MRLKNNNIIRVVFDQLGVFLSEKFKTLNLLSSLVSIFKFLKNF